ncbi:FadR/GntR family transcriptional regulator [Maritalea myrionectae]|uniref:Galactonate operon transcriptional repressor n=1 Tax=Maritalea myrionectae TaxID=454601 RepID=A0A2R4MFY0_9HYPH|nr:FadR/GntR family transcriptional regulator [Maritalea myrionectae]AVX04873.1 galactonate operon transcriptional repressor [Maritalea myrionectae]
MTSSRSSAVDYMMSISHSISAGDNIVHRLGREIVDGRHAPGDRLPDEATMLKRYGVSRTALREAYSKLTAKGMIIARPKVGTSVRPSSDWNMLDADVLTWHLQTRPLAGVAKDLYALRRMLEPGAAAMAATARTEAELQKIEDAYKQMQATSTYEAELVEADLRFHVAILNATHNHFIGAFSSLIHAAMISTFEVSWRGAEVSVFKQERLVQHGDVLEAIRAQDADLARLRMERLLDDSIEDASEVLGQHVKGSR